MSGSEERKAQVNECTVEGSGAIQKGFIIIISMHVMIQFHY